MPNWMPAIAASEVPEGGCCVVEIAGQSIAIFKIAGVCHALDNTCAHQGGPLGEGVIHGTTVSCPWHFWGYDIRTGKNTATDAISVRSYPVETRDDRIFIDIA